MDFYLKNVGFQNNPLPKVKTKGKSMKKDKYLSLILRFKIIWVTLLRVVSLELRVLLEEGSFLRKYDIQNM